MTRIFFVLTIIAVAVAFQNCSGGFTPLMGQGSNQASYSSLQPLNSVFLNKGLPVEFALAANEKFARLNSGFEPEATIYVDGERGVDQGVGSSQQPVQTLRAARDRVKQAKARGAQDILVVLRGVIRLEATEEFGVDDSASAGHFIVYVSDRERPATISGARVLPGRWTAGVAGRMTFPANGLASVRSLSIDDRAVVRARTGQPLLASVINADDTINCAGCGLPQTNSTNAVEVVFAAGWQSARCKGTLDAAGMIRLVSPCAQLALHNVVPVTKVLRIENSPALINGPGQWAFDSVNQTIVYLPKAGEVLAPARVSVPVVEQLIRAKQLSNVAFVGIKFQDAAWRQPQTDVGFASHQADVYRNGEAFSWTTYAGTSQMTASFECVECRGVALMDSEFTNLEGAGVRIGEGSDTNLLFSNRFHEIGGSAIQIGTTDPEKTASAVTRTIVEDNLIDSVAQDFVSSPGIFQYYATDTHISNNTIQNLPYSGISVGWGWTLSTIPNSARNQIAKNHVKNVMGVLQDGGGIYLNAAQAGGKVAHNFLQNVLPGLSGIHPYPSAMGVYLDNGVRGVTVNNNVALGIASQPLFIQNIVEPFAIENTVASDGASEAVVRVESGRRMLPLPPLKAGEQLAYGGMFGYGAEGTSRTVFPNTFTGADSCPVGYDAQQVLGTASLDWPVYYCFRILKPNEEPDYDFGGVYGLGWQKTYPNPKTGAASCPDGFTASQLLGTTNQDWPLHVCSRKHQAGAGSFKGLYGLGSVEKKEIEYGHPQTGHASCPAGSKATIVYGTESLDWALFECD